MSVASETQAMSDIYESRGEKLDTYLTEFSVTENQIGAMFEIDGAVAGLDLFDREGTLLRVLPKLVAATVSLSLVLLTAVINACSGLCPHLAKMNKTIGMVSIK